MARQQPRFRLTAPIPSEDELQLAVYSALRVLLPDGAIIHTHETRNTSVMEGARRKRLGALAGFPDMSVWWNKRVVLMELKRARLGVLSPPQKALHKRFDEQGFPVCVCRSVDDALDACAAAGVPVRGRLMA